jgi:uncharacterized membrane protein
MNEMLVAVFDTEDAAINGLQALRELHQEGGISLYAWALIVKDRDGEISVEQQSGVALVGTALGLLMGGIVGILGGPAGSAVGGSIGAYIGLLADWARHGIDLQFLDDLNKTFEPGKASVLAEIEESWISPLEARLKEQGGAVFRRFRTDMIEDQLLQQGTALQRALENLQNELDSTNAANREVLRKSIVHVKQQLKIVRDRAKAAIDSKKAESDLKMKALRAQVEAAGSETKARIEKRISEAQADFATRTQKLNRALALAKEALGPQEDFEEPFSFTGFRLM